MVVGTLSTLLETLSMVLELSGVLELSRLLASAPSGSNGGIYTLPSMPRDASGLMSLVKHMASVGTGWVPVMSWKACFLTLLS